MISPFFNHTATVAKQFHSSVFHFLAKVSKLCETFLCEKKTMKLSLLHKNLMAITAVELWLKGSRYAKQIVITQAGWVKHVLEPRLLVGASIIYIAVIQIY